MLVSVNHLSCTHPDNVGRTRAARHPWRRHAFKAFGLSLDLLPRASPLRPRPQLLVRYNPTSPFQPPPIPNPRATCSRRAFTPAGCRRGAVASPATSCQASAVHRQPLHRWARRSFSCCSCPYCQASRPAPQAAAPHGQQQPLLLPTLCSSAPCRRPHAVGRDKPAPQPSSPTLAEKLLQPAPLMPTPDAAALPAPDAACCARCFTWRRPHAW